MNHRADAQEARSHSDSSELIPPTVTERSDGQIPRPALRVEVCEPPLNPHTAGLDRLESLVGGQRYLEASALLDCLHELDADRAGRAAELTWQGVIAYRQERYQPARALLSEAQRVLGEPFRDLLCSARIAHYRGLLSTKSGRTTDGADWLQRADELIRCARRASPHASGGMDARRDARLASITLEMFQIREAVQSLDVDPDAESPEGRKP